MAGRIKAVRGTRDILPPDTALWQHVEQASRDILHLYNFQEIRTPILEDTQLFARGVGEETDIVSKEMFTWEDRPRAQSEKAQSLTLRPENTAGVVRAYIEHKMGETGKLEKLSIWVRSSAASARKKAVSGSSIRSVPRSWGRPRQGVNRQRGMRRSSPCWRICCMKSVLGNGRWS
jgi:hypothetical protein